MDGGEYRGSEGYIFVEMLGKEPTRVEFLGLGSVSAVILALSRSTSCISFLKPLDAPHS